MTDERPTTCARCGEPLPALSSGLRWGVTKRGELVHLECALPAKQEPPARPVPVSQETGD